MTDPAPAELVALAGDLLLRRQPNPRDRALAELLNYAANTWEQQHGFIRDHLLAVARHTRDAARTASGQQPAQCSCGHDPHAPGTECEAGVDHPPKRWHRCLCLARPGADRACPVQMSCQGGTLGYSDIWHLQHGHAVIGRTKAIPAAEQPDPTIADDPTPLRWGLGDVLWGDDDTTIVCLSGPDREPYWLGLDAERAAALRDDLMPPQPEQPETCRPIDVNGTTVLVRGSGDWTETDQHHMAAIVAAAKRRYEAEHPAVGQPAEAQATEAHPADVTWTVEKRGDTDWLQASSHHDDREKALARLASRREQFPLNEFRLVRETTTWTVEDESQ